MTALTTSPPATAVAEPPARFRDLLASEWIKTRSLRSTPWTIALTVLFVIGSAAVATLADSAARSGPADFLPYDAYPPAGYWTLILVAGSTGALTMVSEYSSGLIRTTTVAVPARGSVVLAKAAVTAALWTAVGTVISTGSFLVSQAILSERHGGVPLTHPGVFRALVASALLAPVCALIGLGLGALLRHSAATMVTIVLTLLMLPPCSRRAVAGRRTSTTRWCRPPGSAWSRTGSRIPAPWDTPPRSPAPGSYTRSGH